MTLGVRCASVLFEPYPSSKCVPFSVFAPLECLDDSRLCSGLSFLDRACFAAVVAGLEVRDLEAAGLAGMVGEGEVGKERRMVEARPPPFVGLGCRMPR